MKYMVLLCDGMADTLIADVDQDGQIDAAAFDLDGDGDVDHLIHK